MLPAGAAQLGGRPAGAWGAFAQCTSTERRAVPLELRLCMQPFTVHEYVPRAVQHGREPGKVQSCTAHTNASFCSECSVLVWSRHPTPLPSPPPLAHHAVRESVRSAMNSVPGVMALPLIACTRFWRPTRHLRLPPAPAPSSPSPSRTSSSPSAERPFCSHGSATRAYRLYIQPHPMFQTACYYQPRTRVATTQNCP
jgi:hypothetical protein